MKKEILMFIIGILVGAIITAGVFLVLKGKTNNPKVDFQDRPSMDGNFVDGGQRPEKRQNQNTTNTDTTTTTSNEANS